MSFSGPSLDTSGSPRARVTELPRPVVPLKLLCVYAMEHRWSTLLVYLMELHGDGLQVSGDPEKEDTDLKSVASKLSFPPTWFHSLKVGNLLFFSTCLGSLSKAKSLPNCLHYLLPSVEIDAREESRAPNDITTF